MQWPCKHIKDSGSDASLFITESLDKKQDEEIIKTFNAVCDIDAKAKFVFLSKSTDKAPKDAIPFDMYGAEFTHYGDDCTFETLH